MNRFPPPDARLGGSAAHFSSAEVDLAGSSSKGGSGRETGGVSDFPPPPPPPPGVGNPSPVDPPSAPAAPATGGGSGWDWDRAKQMAEAWFRPLTDPQGWWALGYLFFSAVASPFLFGAMVAVAAIAFGLSFIVVGLLLVVPLFLMVEQFALVERYFAALAGHRIELLEAQPITGAGPRNLKRVITDPVRWRHVGFVALNVVLAPVLFAIGAFPLSFVAQAVFGDGIINGPGFRLGTGLDIGAAGILALPLAAFFAGAIPRVSIWIASLKAQIDSWFLGTDQLAIAELRVNTLSDQRQDILDAVASERRRIERNLHDGVQQQLVAIGLDLGMAGSHIERDPERAKELIESARQKVQGSIGELRQLGRGLHPAILEDRGIDAALSAVVSGSPIPISVHVDPGLTLSTDVAETVYFVANEAIANVLKHAEARVGSIHVTGVGNEVRVVVHDDGVGGVDPARGTGVAGIRARVHAVDGTLTITSPVGGPTTLLAEIPNQR
jgi:signal transduction histidine kinase